MRGRVPRRIVAWLGAIGAVLAVQALFFVVFAGGLSLPPVASFLLGFACSCGGVLAVSALAPAPRWPWLALVLVPAGIVAVVAWAGDAGASPLRVALVTAALLAAGTLIGGIVGGRVQQPGHLLVVVYVSTLADVYSVLAPSGPSARVAESERMLSLLAISWPMPEQGAATAVPLLGVGDIMMTAVYAVAARSLGLGLVRTVVALAVAYAVTAALLLALGRALPALPMLGLAIVVAHPRSRYLPRGERRTAAIGMAAITVAFAVLWLAG